MNVFGIGIPELAVIGLVAILVFGPDKLPEVARQAAQLVRQARRIANNARDQLREELGPEYADLELRDLDPRRMVARQLQEAMAELDEIDASRPVISGPELRPGERPPFDIDAT